jgi:hypothetical protein
MLISRKLGAFGREVKAVNGHFAFSSNERDFYVAALLRGRSSLRHCWESGNVTASQPFSN